SLVESSAVGATGATLAALFKRRLTWRVMDDTMRQTLSITCMFMFIILAALCFGAVYDGLGAKNAIRVLMLETWDLTPWEILIMMLVSFVILGMFLDDTAMLVIVAPLYIPLVLSMGFSPIWFGVLYVITCQVAYITPPFGYNLFLMRAMAPPEITLVDIYRSIVPFVGIMLVTIAIVMAFPQIALWLPEMYSGR
ncbi:MAG: TRAP transporter large permease subunit, partial [Parvibaculum sp.]|nr:TRAP transporter large permease subunit [Parvibaculum sp.]